MCGRGREGGGEGGGEGGEGEEGPCLLRALEYLTVLTGVDQKLVFSNSSMIGLL